MNPGTIRTALQTRLKSINGLQVYRTWPNGPVNTPCAIIRRARAEPEQTFGRGDLTKWAFELYVFTTLAPGYQQAQDNIDRYIATSSTGGIYGAIHADRTLGGTVASTFVKGFSPDDQYDFGPDVVYQGFVAEVECWST